MNKQKGKDRHQRIDSAITREKILSAAEKLFVEKGIDHVSLSEIVTAAGQRNRSVIKYYFNNKMDIIDEILEKHEIRIRKIINRRLKDLAKHQNPTTNETIRALIEPTVDSLKDPDGGVYINLMVQMMSHPQYSIVEHIVKNIANNTDMISNWSLKLWETPGGKQYWWSLWFLWFSILFHSLADYAKARKMSPDNPDLPTLEMYKEHLVQVLEYITRSPVQIKTD